MPGISMLEWINAVANMDDDEITKEEFAEAMRIGDESLKKEALEKMELQGGYECLA